MQENPVKLYVSVANQQIMTDKHSSPWEYELTITREYIPIFEHLFEQMNHLEFRNFLRSHLPYVPYHFDSDNTDIDVRTMKLYALIHEFTDTETRLFIEKLPYFRPEPEKKYNPF
ncbi:transposase [Sporosarcina sp. NCCP-2222]|uniref:transposase n=1 Tax=Sporosarcina sp. NCCP-2222 TaxID=2935073 RepID=UPI0020C0F979|nr:transposase [Sporosarcina sp. NCCP-2222]